MTWSTDNTYRNAEMQMQEYNNILTGVEIDRCRNIKMQLQKYQRIHAVSDKLKTEWQ
jgi:hypothetical protein